MGGSGDILSRYDMMAIVSVSLILELESTRTGMNPRGL